MLFKMQDGQFHSGQELGALLGVSRAAVWKKLQQLEQFDIDVEAVKGKGYRVVGGLDLLDRKKIVQDLASLGRDVRESLFLFSVVDSTNVWLMKKSAALSGGAAGLICLAEMQNMGRGRRGRVWQSPFARNIYLSISWTFSQGVTAVEGLSLAVGVVLCDALEKLGVEGLELKWPNDLLNAGKKIGGVLIELVGDANGDCHVIVGVGFNVAMPSYVEVDQSWTDLRSICQANVSRSQIAVGFIDTLFTLFSTYEKDGFRAYQSDWEAKNAHKNKRVTLFTPTEKFVGTFLGVSSRGELRMQVDQRVLTFAGGEISLREAE